MAVDDKKRQQPRYSAMRRGPKNDSGRSDTVTSHLPEWLIGVIVVVIILILVFFAMIVYSLIKERNRTQAGSYEGTASGTSSGDISMEAGKTDGTFRVTGSSLDPLPADLESAAIVQADNGSNGDTWTLDGDIASTLQRRHHGPSGCQNPVFVDDDDVDNNANDDISAETDLKPNGKVLSEKETGKNNDHNEGTNRDTKQNGKVTHDKNNRHANDYENKVNPENADKVTNANHNAGHDIQDSTNKPSRQNRKSSSLSSRSPKASSHKSCSTTSKTDPSSSKNGSSENAEEMELVRYPSGRSNRVEKESGQCRDIGKSEGKEKDQEGNDTFVGSTVDEETVIDDVMEENEGGRSVRVKTEGKTEEDQISGRKAEIMAEDSSSGAAELSPQMMIMREGCSSSSEPQTCMMTVYRDQQE